MKYKIISNELEINYTYDKNSENEINELILSNDITKLILKSNILIPIDNLPNGISELVIYNNIHFDLDNLPNSIERIYLVNLTNPLNNLCKTV